MGTYFRGWMKIKYFVEHIFSDFNEFHEIRQLKSQRKFIPLSYQENGEISNMSNLSSQYFSTLYLASFSQFFQPFSKFLRYGHCSFWEVFGHNKVVPFNLFTVSNIFCLSLKLKIFATIVLDPFLGQLFLSTRCALFMAMFSITKYSLWNLCNFSSVSF